MNLDAEIAKTEERLAGVNLDADKLRATQAKPDYEKTPAAVKEANADKVCPSFITVWQGSQSHSFHEKLRRIEAEISNFQLTRDLFMKLKLGSA